MRYDFLAFLVIKIFKDSALWVHHEFCIFIELPPPRQQLLCSVYKEKLNLKLELYETMTTLTERILNAHMLDFGFAFFQSRLVIVF